MIRKHTTYTMEIDDETYPLPFNPDSEPKHVYQAANGLKTVVAFLAHDDSPADPFEEFDEGEFYQFSRNHKHYTQRPDIEEFKRIVRANKGRVVAVNTCGDGYRAGEPVTPAQCRNKNCACEAEQIIDDADGYYIAPEDATNPLEYYKRAIKVYSNWCKGEVYGVCIWTYTRASISEDWEDPERYECWGFYGYDYASEELLSEFKSTAFGNDPSAENKGAK